MNEWVWRTGGMIPTGGNWSTGRKILYSVGGRWMNEYGELVEWYRRGETEVLGEKRPSVSLSSTNPTWTDLASKAGFRSERPATDCLNQGTACVVAVTIFSRNSLQMFQMEACVPRSLRVCVASPAGKFSSPQDPDRPWPVPTAKRNVRFVELTTPLLPAFRFIIGGALLHVPHVNIETCYGLDDSGIESRWRWDFPHLSRPALGPTQAPVQGVLGLSRG
jgi:hypothetical protein